MDRKSAGNEPPCPVFSELEGVFTHAMDVDLWLVMDYPEYWKNTVPLPRPPNSCVYHEMI